MFIKSYIIFPLIILGGIFITNSPLIAQFRVTIDELVHDPERFFGMQVRITGSVISVYEDGYVLKNDVGLVIRISSSDIPVIDEKYDIVVGVAKRADSNLPLLTEISRKKFTGGYSWLIISLTILFMGVFSTGGGSGP